MVQLERLNQANVASASTQASATEQPQYQFQCIDSEWILVEERTASCDECYDCEETVFYNVLTGEEIAQ